MGNFLNLAVLILRIVIGIIFIGHGAQKLFGAFGGSGIEGFSSMLKDLGITPALFLAYLAAVAEGLGGLFVLLGRFFRA